MKKLLLVFFPLLVFIFMAKAQTLVHHWNFNNSASETTLLTPSVSEISGASITHNVGPNASAIPLTGNTTGQGFEITNPNAKNGDASASHLRFNNPVGASLVFALPTTGYKDVIVKYGTRRSGSGAHNQIIDYSTDGTTYTNFTTIMPVDGNPTVQTLDFTTISAVKNNPNFKVKISFTQGGGGLAGNNRFDNFSLEGNAISLLHYWNFNNSTSETTLLTPSVSEISGASITHNVGPNASAIPITGNTTGQGFETTNPNARNSDASASHLRFNNPVGASLVFTLPTTGFQNIIVKYGTRRSGSGAHNQIIDYSTDGTTYTNFTTIMPVDGDPTVQTLDFTAINAVKNNPDFKVRISFTQGGGGLAGNNRFDNFSIEGSLNGGADVVAPTVTFSPVNNATTIPVNKQPTLTFNEDVRLIDNSALDNTNVDALIELRLNDASGAIVPFDATVSGKVITIIPTSALANNQTYYVALKANVIEDISNNAITSIQSATFTTNSTITFADNFISVDENAGFINVTLTLANPANGSVDLVLKAAPFSNTDASDITYTSQTLNFTGASNTTQTISIPVIDDIVSEMDEYFVLSLENLSGVSLVGKQYLTVYIKDNDRQAPVPTEEITLNYVSSFKPNVVNGSTTEIVVHDAETQRLFITSSVQNRLDIANFSNPSAITLITSIDMTPYGGITSVAVKNGVVAVACPNANEQLDGTVVFFNTNGVYQKQVTVGALPDMITFSPDGNKIFTANEGQPNVAYTVDPEGSVSIIDISGGLASVNQSKVNTLLFTDFNAQEATLISSGVRKTKSTSTLSQDFEPEYVTISADSKKAWVVLQENNAIAELNLENNTYSSIWPLGKKDFNVSGSGLDASDNSGKVHISNYPVKSFFMPDGIANYTVNGKTYLVAANEGDEKEYGSFVERTTVGAVTLDPTIFPNAAVLKQNNNLGRLRISNLSGDTDNDGDYDELVMVGSRSFSIFDTDTKSIVYDNKDDFELITSKSPITAAFFNADNESNGFKSRSRAKGPEPEGVTVANINGNNYAFVSLERVGGVMVYNITDPANVKFVDYKNNRTTDITTSDLGPEGIIFIPANASPDGKAYITIANEFSGNISVFEVVTTTLPIELISYQAKLQNDGKVMLNWSTASELDNDYFTIERSTDGKTFSALTKVKTKGNGNSKQDYSFVDFNPTSGNNYYRLTQTDINGTQSKPEIRYVNVSLFQNANWTVYPNPLTGITFNVNTSQPNLTEANVKLYDLSGKLIYSRKLPVTSGKLEIKLSEKPITGMYILYINELGGQQLLIN